MNAKFHSESGISTTGAQVELGFVEHEGTQFVSVSSVVDHAQGVVIGHSTRKSSTATRLP